MVTLLKDIRSSHPKSLIFSHVNINSLKKERKAPIDYFKDILLNGFSDVLCISESKLDESISDHDLECSPSFKLHRQDRDSNSGGLCLWIRADIPHQRMKDLEFTEKSIHIETMVFELRINKEIWYLVLAYKNPKVQNITFITYLSKLYESIFVQGKEIMLLGDFNIDMLISDNTLKNDLCDIYALSNIVKEPTCYKKPEGTLVDPIIVKNARRFAKSFTVTCGFSDCHNLVGCVTKLHAPPKKPNKVTYRSLKNFDINDFKLEVSRMPFFVGDIFEDESDKYWFKQQLFSNALNESAPIKTRSIKEEHIPYMNSTLRKAMYKRNMLRNIYRKDPKNNQKWEAYRKQRNKVVYFRKTAIRDYFSSCSKPGAGPKVFWDAVGPFLAKNSKSKRNIMLKEDDKVITNTKEVCEIFAKFFSTIADTIGSPDVIDMSRPNFLSEIFEKHKNHESILKIKEHHSNNSPFSFKPVSVTYVKGILSKIKANKSTGCDEIPPKVVKMCSEELSVPLTDMINSAFQNNIFPDDLKYADLAPIFKKLDDMLKENYRPVSILPVFSKIFEIVIADQLIEYFKTIFNEMLCAYRKKYGCNHLIVKLIESWKFALDKGLFAGTILMDLSKAFDCMPHGLQIAKMKAYGLTDDACMFLCSYLSGRYQRVKVSDERSSWMPVSKGIPQGSCLGPFLFNVFINDLFYFIEICTLFNYADDNSLSAIDITMELVMAALKTDAENAIHWFTINLMQANPQKFHCMLLKALTCKESIPEAIEIDNIKIPVEEYVKLLGITIDDKLKFDKHIDILCKNASRQINVMYRFAGVFNFKQREAIHNTFILSNFNYCPVVWHFCSKASTKKMEKIQERALRFLFNDKISSYEALLEKCKSTTLHLKRLKVIALEVFKSLHGLNPSFMKDMFNVKEISYNLRDPLQLVQPKFRKITYGRNSFTYYGSHLWNILPNQIKSCTTMDDFKTMLKTWEGPNCQCSLCNVL